MGVVFSDLLYIVRGSPFCPMMADWGAWSSVMVGGKRRLGKPKVAESAVDWVTQVSQFYVAYFFFLPGAIGKREGKWLAFSLFQCVPSLWSGVVFILRNAVRAGGERIQISDAAPICNFPPYRWHKHLNKPLQHWVPPIPCPPSFLSFISLSSSLPLPLLHQWLRQQKQHSSLPLPSSWVFSRPRSAAMSNGRGADSCLHCHWQHRRGEYKAGGREGWAEPPKNHPPPNPLFSEFLRQVLCVCVVI